MSRTINNVTAWPLRTLPKDIGVAVVVVVAFALGLLLRLNTELSTSQYHDTNSGFSMQYPALWRMVSSSDGALMSVQDPRANSAYKTTVSVETRQLDPGSPPTL